jgi:hypothetical protein
MSLSPIQQQALDELFAQIAARPAPEPDLLAGLTGVSLEDWKRRLFNVVKTKDALELSFIDWVGRKPLDATLTFLGGAAMAFYRAERDVNPKIQSYTDAFYYISTCASVGYADIFAMTQTGKAIASLVMIVGPALAAKSLDRPAEDGVQRTPRHTRGEPTDGG